MFDLTPPRRRPPLPSFPKKAASFIVVIMSLSKRVVSRAAAEDMTSHFIADEGCSELNPWNLTRRALPCGITGHGVAWPSVLETGVSSLFREFNVSGQVS